MPEPFVKLTPDMKPGALSREKALPGSFDKRHEINTGTRLLQVAAMCNFSSPLTLASNGLVPGPFGKILVLIWDTVLLAADKSICSTKWQQGPQKPHPIVGCNELALYQATSWEIRAN